MSAYVHAPCLVLINGVPPYYSVVVDTRMAGDLDSIHHTTPAGEAGEKNKHFFFFVGITLCDNRNEEAYPHMANNVTSHHTPRTTYYTWYCSGLLLGCTLHGRVFNGHAILTCTRSSA